MIPAELALAAVAALGALAVGRAALTRRRGALSSETQPDEPAPADDSFEHLLRELPVAAILVDRGGRLAFANRQAGELFRFDEVRGAGLALIEAVLSVQLERLVDSALAGERTVGTIVLRPPEGEVTIEVTAIPAAGGGAFVVGEDRTDVVAMERVRRDFLADVSHELRTPISSIRLMAETIEMSNGDPEALGMFLPQILTELTRMTSLVEDLLDLARSEAGQIRLQLLPVDLRTLVGAALDTFRPRAEVLGIELALEPGAHLRAQIDSERITQVVVNLVDNALRHTQAGGHVRVSVEARGDEAELTIRDDGAGIPFKDLRHVFERFYVVERSRSRESSGTGLGLAIVKQIVDAHGGRIHVDSELGNGATFVCRLPLNAPLRPG